LFSSSGHQGGIPRFHLVALDGRPPVRLRPDILERFRPAYVAWRPDGQSVSIWGRQPDDRRAFLTASIREGTPTESSIDPAVETRRREADLRLDRFMWSPSGKYLYFEGAAQGTASLWRITVDPKALAWVDGPDRLTTSTTQDTDAALSPDGRRVVFSARSARTRLWMFPFDAAAGKLTGAGQPVTSGAAGELDADVPDDGSKLVYRTLRGARQQVWERDVIAGKERLLVDADAWTRTRPRWSSDGHRLSYLRRRVLADGNAGEGAVAILSVDRGQESLLTRPGSGDLIPSDWSQDGKWLLGGCPRPESRTVGICVVEVTGAQPGSEPIRVIVSDRNHNLFEQRFSPDQRWISFIAVNAADADRPDRDPAVPADHRHGE
jgi:dipeptidyl aminopeptidase/acylaminoacyl peptidase